MGFSDNYRLFLHWLKQERARHLGALTLHGAVRFLAATGLIWLLAITLGVFPLPAQPLLVLAMAGTLAGLVFYLVLPLLRVPGLKGFARKVDLAFPALKDRTINSLELGARLAEEGGVDAASHAAYEPTFIAALVSDTRSRVEGLDVRRALAPRGLGRWAGGLAVVVALTATLLALSPDRFGASARRLLNPSHSRAPFGLKVTPGDLTVKPGEDVPISAEVRGAKGAPRLFVRGDFEAWRETRLEPQGPSAGPDAGSGEGSRWSRFAVTLSSVQRSMTYRVEVDGHRSPTYTLRLKEPLAVLSFRKQLTFPGYSGLPPQELSSATGELDGLKGTQVSLEIETSGDVASAAMVRGSSVRALERVDAHHFEVRFPLVESGEYRIRLNEPAGGASAEAGPYALNVLPDADPTVRMLEPETSGFLPTDLHVPVAAECADDYGLTRADLVYQGQDGAPHRVPLSLPAGLKQAQVSLDWDASTLNLGPGEGVTLWVEVRDNDNVSGPKVARSETRNLRVPSVAEMFKQAEAENDENIQDLTQISKEQEELKSKLEEATRALNRSEGMSWEKKKEVEAAVARQKELLDKISRTGEQITESLDKVQEQNQVREEVTRKMEELRDLMKQLDSPQLREMMRKLDEALKKANPDDVRRALENMKMTEQDLLAALERTLQALKQLQKAEKLNAAAKLAEELAKQQKDLADRIDAMQQQKQPDSKGGKNDKNAPQAQNQTQAQQSDQRNQEARQMAKQQSDLRKQAEALAKDVEDLKKDLAQQAPQTGPKMDSAQKQIQQEAAKDMARSEQELAQQTPQTPQEQQQQQKQDASQQESGQQEDQQQQQKPQQPQNSSPSRGSKQHKSPSHGAQQSMSHAAQTLRQVQQMLEHDTNQELADKVRQAAHELVGVSGKQDEVTHSPDVPSELAQRQQSLVDGTSQVVQQLHKAEDDFGPLPGDIQAGLGQALDHMKSSRDLFEKGNTFAGRSLGQEAQSGVNKVVIRMLDAAQSMCNSSGQGMGGQKPGAQQRMSGLSQQQAKVNRSSEQAMKMGQAQRQKPGNGGRPGQQGENGTAQMARLAAEQDAVRKGLQDLLREEMQHKQLLGNLNNVADQMKKVSDDLANNQMNEQTVDMEKKILSRMLDAQRSLNRRDRDPERWSRPGEMVARPAPGQLPQALLQKPQRSGLDLLRERREPVPAPFLPAVEQYFRNLPTTPAAR